MRYFECTDDTPKLGGTGGADPWSETEKMVLLAVDNLGFVDALVLRTGAGVEGVQTLLDLRDEVLVLR